MRLAMRTRMHELENGLPGRSSWEVLSAYAVHP